MDKYMKANIILIYNYKLGPGATYTCKQPTEVKETSSLHLRAYMAQNRNQMSVHENSAKIGFFLVLSLTK